MQAQAPRTSSAVAARPPPSCSTCGVRSSSALPVPRARAESSAWSRQISAISLAGAASPAR
eukprot:5614091-Prymnesium_polylepis.1